MQNLFDPLADEVNLYLPNAGMEPKSVNIFKVNQLLQFRDLNKNIVYGVNCWVHMTVELVRTPVMSK